MPVGLEFEVRFRRPAGEAVRPAPAGPFRILVLGDLTGRGAGEREALAGRRPVAVDAGTFDDAMARFAPRLRPALPGLPPAEVSFECLEDFHPDGLLERLPLFDELRELRSRLLDPATFAEAAQRIGGPLGVSPSPAPRRDGAPEDDAATLQRLLGRSGAQPGPAPEARPSTIGLGRFLHQVVTPHAVAGAHPRRDVYLRAVDEALGERMRALLHDPHVQTLEALWRSAHGLVTELELDEDLQVFLLDATAEELAADLREAGGDLERSALYRLLVEAQGPETPGGEPWALLVGDYAFGQGEEDLALLEALGAVASRSGGPFLARARPELLGCRSLAESPDPRQWQPLDERAAARWQALRRSPSARWLGLALPRVLLRLPYGRATDPVEGFAFEEWTPFRDHEAYLWGNPAFAGARLLAEAFRDRGWDLEPGDRLEIGDLPAHVVEEEGEKVLVPCAEVCLGERAAEAVLARGLMPLLCYRNRNAVRLARFQSLAEPPGPLAGSWD